MTAAPARIMQKVKCMYVHTSASMRGYLRRTIYIHTYLALYVVLYIVHSKYIVSTYYYYVPRPLVSGDSGKLYIFGTGAVDKLIRKKRRGKLRK